jgi:hypothetical protein
MRGVRPQTARFPAALALAGYTRTGSPVAMIPRDAAVPLGTPVNPGDTVLASESSF